jgi:hypothetical protein
MPPRSDSFNLILDLLSKLLAVHTSVGGQNNRPSRRLNVIETVGVYILVENMDLLRLLLSKRIPLDKEELDHKRPNKKTRDRKNNPNDDIENISSHD